MTDAFIVDKAGSFVVGKALSTPEDEAIGAINSLTDGLKHWNTQPQDAAKSIAATIYSGTAILNRVLTREGTSPLGVIVTAGFEDILRMERGIQVWLGLSYADRLHSASHHHNEPIVSRKFIKGVRERVDVFGQPIVPLYEHEAKKAVEELLDQGAKAILVCLNFGFRNPAHEQRIGEIAEKVMAARASDVPIFLSHKHNPVRGEFPRLQTMILEAYAAAPARFHFKSVSEALKKQGSKAPMRVFTCYGGSIPVDHEWLVSTMISGPIGGLTGAKYVAEVLGLENLVCSDVGGTSFDVGLITEGRIALDVEPVLGRMKLAIPSLVLNSIGAGTGTYVRLDPVIKRMELGPDSAGPGIGMCVNEQTPTLNDCNLLLGYLNPDYFLGGDIELDLERARAGIQAQIAGPLGIRVEEACSGVIDIINSQMRDHLYAMILGRGFSPENYSVIGYGGGGPLHFCGYIEGLGFEKALVPSWAPAFSAFGCACSDYAFRYDQQLDFPLSPGGDEAHVLAGILNDTWQALKAKVESEMLKEGLPADQMRFETFVRLQYQGQLDDIEIHVSKFPVEAADIAGVVRDFDEVFGRIFPTASKSPELGYLFTRAVAQGVLPTEKPEVRRYELKGETPPKAAEKPARNIYWKGEWIGAKIFEMDQLDPGNVIHGPAVIEHPATTFLVPPGFVTRLSAHRIFEVEARKE
jgi:acetone carboxylase beta subunit